MNLSVLIAVRHTSSGTDDRSDDDRTLSASGFSLGLRGTAGRSLFISSASWLSSLLDIGLDDGSGCITWSWKTQLPSEFVALYEVTPACLLGGLLITKSMWPGITVATEVHGRVLINCTQTQTGTVSCSVQ